VLIDASTGDAAAVYRLADGRVLVVTWNLLAQRASTFSLSGRSPQSHGSILS